MDNDMWTCDKNSIYTPEGNLHIKLLKDDIDAIKALCNYLNDDMTRGVKQKMVKVLPSDNPKNTFEYEMESYNEQIETNKQS